LALDAALIAIVTICILVFSAKVLGEVFSWRKIPSVLGELTAGVILGPFALGSLLVVNGTPLIEMNEIVRAFGGIGGILILFIADLEMTFRDFTAGHRRNYNRFCYQSSRVDYGLKIGVEGARKSCCG